MRLTVYTDFSLRLLMFLAVNPDRLCTIEEVARAYDISRNHLMKVAHQLGLSGYVETVRGRNGGLRLAMRTDDIRIGDVVMATEPDFALVECLGEHNNCVITPACKLMRVLAEAQAAFINTLNQYRLSELVDEPNRIRRLFVVNEL